MMVNFSIKHILLMLVINLSFFLIKINGESSEVWEKGARVLSRQKREDGEGPEVIKIKIQKKGKEEEVEVSKLKENYIANKNLKVWTVHLNTSNSETKSRIELKNSVNEEVGEWDMYQNKTFKSAVVYFRKLKLLGGIVGKKRYTVNFVNYDGKNDITLNDPPDEASTRRKRETNKIFHELADTFSAIKRNKRSVDNTTITPKIEFYLESLVIISGSLTNSFSSTISDIELLKYKHYVMHVLAFFNLINVRFPSTFKINVAGILLKEKTDDLPFLEVKNALDKGNNEMKLLTARDALVNFLQENDPKIGSEIYDYAIHLTDYSMHNEHTDKNMNAFLSYPTQGIYAARKSKSPNSHPIVITSINFTYTSVSYATDQIYHIIGGWNYVKQKNSTESYRVITEDIHDCECCFLWNEDWCAFINEPHSLGSTPRKLLTIDEHCWCSDFDYRYQNTTNGIATDICADGFQCQNINDNSKIKITKVINGTPCGEKKVCWNNVCVSET